MPIGQMPGPYKLVIMSVIGVGAVQDFLNDYASQGYSYVGQINDGRNLWVVFKKNS